MQIWMPDTCAASRNGWTICPLASSLHSTHASGSTNDTHQRFHFLLFAKLSRCALSTLLLFSFLFFLKYHNVAPFFPRNDSDPQLPNENFSAVDAQNVAVETKARVWQDLLSSFSLSSFKRSKQAKEGKRKRQRQERKQFAEPFDDTREKQQETSWWVRDGEPRRKRQAREWMITQLLH